ncbi:hypothetical protein Nocox_26315 [Nonomuraea coxensis DSM 45129]|uniref:Secreted protein n=1 Tax=Nonomuraea coxensis DSM 45129 TaxID=1122611 RepID=A0ABX8U7P0_9ACTN|nr:hypothetical protein [Nonomuraea coxensis]QYC42864.1 hypothetical protein Nocox_26315 [Nonomuraea coxensis DSM 45129]
MGSRTAISAGVLAVALVAVPGAAPAVAATAGAQDCTRDGGLLSGVTNTLCDVVGTLTGTVDALTGGVTDPVTRPVEKTTDELLGRVGEVVPTGRPTGSGNAASPSPDATRTARSHGQEDDGCDTPVACAGEPVPRSGTTTSAPPQRERPSQPSEKKKPAATATTSPTSGPAVPAVTASPPWSARPRPADDDAREENEESSRSTADPEEPRVELLWPNPFARELTVPLQDQRVVRPTPPASDVLGTVLTIALLGSAVLATRIVQQRRQRTEPVESIPFEPARVGGGSRQRLA